MALPSEMPFALALVLDWTGVVYKIESCLYLKSISLGLHVGHWDYNGPGNVRTTKRKYVYRKYFQDSMSSKRIQVVTISLECMR